LDDGVVFAPDDTPLRKLRRQQVQQLSWSDDDGQTQLQVTIPREQVLLIEDTSY